MSYFTFLIYTIAWQSFAWGSFGWLVVEKGWSPWWLALSFVLSAGQFKPGRWSELERA